MHTTFNQTVTAPGRLSSSDPNLQNIPVRTEEGRRIRSLFVPGKGFSGFMSADYSQIELRILAHLSGDEKLREAFLHQEDIHRRTAAEVLHKDPKDVTAAERSHAKAVNFGIIYGISDYGLARDLGISREEAGETMYGRFRVLPDIHSRNFNRRSFAERTALNTPIQGAAADIIKRAMNNVYWALVRNRLKSRMLLQVHDELVLEVVEEERDIVTQILEMHMPGAAELAVPLVVDIHYGTNWEPAERSVARSGNYRDKSSSRQSLCGSARLTPGTDRNPFYRGTAARKILAALYRTVGARRALANDGSAFVSDTRRFDFACTR